MGIEFNGEVYDYVYPHINNKLVFDVGANCGEVTKKFIDKEARVVSIEPQKEISIGDNFKGVLAIENVCLSNKVDELTFYKGDPKHTTISTCLKEWKKNHPTAKWTEIVVKTTTLDKLIERYGIPTYIKVDTEGWEPKILEGLHYKIPYISFEFTEGYQKEFYMCMNEIKRLGFKDFTTFIKKKIKKTVNGKRILVRAYKEVDSFLDVNSVLRFFDNLPEKSQGDILIRS